MVAPNTLGKGLYQSGEFNSTIINTDLQCYIASPAANSKVIVAAPVDATIIGWLIMGTVSGSCVMDVWRTSVAGATLPAIPTITNTITGTYGPTLTSSGSAFGGSPPGYVPNASSMKTLGWGNVNILAGDFIIFNVTSYTAGGAIWCSLLCQTGS